MTETPDAPRSFEDVERAITAYTDALNAFLQADARFRLQPGPPEAVASRTADVLKELNLYVVAFRAHRYADALFFKDDSLPEDARALLEELCARIDRSAAAEELMWTKRILYYAILLQSRPEHFPAATRRSGDGQG